MWIFAYHPPRDLPMLCGPFFFRAPVPSGCASALVPSKLKQSTSPLFTCCSRSAANSRSSTPLRDQRRNRAYQFPAVDLVVQSVCPEVPVREHRRREARPCGPEAECSLLGDRPPKPNPDSGAEPPLYFSTTNPACRIIGAKLADANRRIKNVLLVGPGLRFMVGGGRPKADHVGFFGMSRRYAAGRKQGQRQRAAFARVVVGHPRAFLMDEPLSNLDAKLCRAMRVQIKHLHANPRS